MSSRFTYALVLLLAVGAVAAGCESGRVRVDRLSRFTEELVFGGSLDAHVGAERTLVRWQRPIRVGLEGKGAERYRPTVESLLAQLSDITGIQSEVVGASAWANVSINFVEDPAFLVNREYVDCYVSLTVRDGWITRAEIHASTARRDKVAHCLAHEVVHVYGLQYHSGIVRSVLSPAHEEHAPTPWDELALKALYDPRLRPGMTRQEAVPVLREIIAELADR